MKLMDLSDITVLSLETPIRFAFRLIRIITPTSISLTDNIQKYSINGYPVSIITRDANTLAIKSGDILFRIEDNSHGRCVLFIEYKNIYARVDSTSIIVETDDAMNRTKYKLIIDGFNTIETKTEYGTVLPNWAHYLETDATKIMNDFDGDVNNTTIPTGYYKRLTFSVEGDKVNWSSDSGLEYVGTPVSKSIKWNYPDGRRLFLQFSDRDNYKALISQGFYKYSIKVVNGVHKRVKKTKTISTASVRVVRECCCIC